MACRILEEHGCGRAVLYCSSADWAFGPVFQSVEEAEDFLKWYPADPRSIRDWQLEAFYSDFRRVYQGRDDDDNPIYKNDTEVSHGTDSHSHCPASEAGENPRSE